MSSYIRLGQGKLQQAEPLFRRALAIVEKSLGPAHPNIVSYLEQPGWALREDGKGEGGRWVLGPGGGNGEKAGRAKVRGGEDWEVVNQDLKWGIPD